MTPKEKAAELVDKMYCSNKWNPDEDYNPLQQYQRMKKCALIAVEEIIDELVDIDDGQTTMPYKYWQNVKTEIQNL